MGEPQLYLGPDSQTVVLATFRGSAEAALAEANLRGAGIACATAGGIAADVTPQFGGGGAGGVRLLVRPEDAERAAKYLPDSAIGRPAVVDALDRQFKRFAFVAVVGLAALFAVTVALCRVLGDAGLAFGGALFFITVVGFLRSAKPAPADESEDDEEPGAADLS